MPDHPSGAPLRQVHTHHARCRVPLCSVPHGRAGVARRFGAAQNEQRALDAAKFTQRDY